MLALRFLRFIDEIVTAHPSRCRVVAVVDDRNATTLESQAVVPMPEPPQDGRNGQDATQTALEP